jgi:hypothetical protein
MTSENDLREALKRQQPPEGFAERTLAGVRARANAEDGPPASIAVRHPGRRPMRASAWAAAVAATLAIAAGTAHVVNQQREADARLAAEQLTLALRVTTDTLHDVETKVFLTSQRGESSNGHQPSR